MQIVAVIKERVNALLMSCSEKFLVGRDRNFVAMDRSRVIPHP